MKTLYSITTLFLVLCCTTAQYAQSHKILKQDIKVAEMSQLTIKNSPTTDVKVEYTKGTELFVKTQVRLSVKNDELMNFLANSERYQLTIEANNKQLVLSTPQDQESIDLGNSTVKEYISYTIYIPKTVNEVAFIQDNERNPWKKLRQERKTPKYWVSNL
ncbi:MAG: hypothetical protein GY810_06230 [Aureispira sp.]|nr:hypothetical protein [Aureispira sp.]